MRLLYDTNVVLDAVLRRQPWASDAETLFRSNRSGEIDGHLVATTITDLFYLIRRHFGRERARRSTRECINSFTIIPVDEQLLIEADRLPGNDLEDNLQLAAATAWKLDGMVTRDRRGFPGSAIPVMTPAEAVAWVESQKPNS